MSLSITSSPSSAGSKLQSRRGSLAAPDPFAQNARVECPRGQTSRLTIIRTSSSSEGSSPSRSGSDVGNVGVGKPRVRSTSCASPSLSTLNIPSPTRTRVRASGPAQAGSEAPEGTRNRMSFARSSFLPEAKPTIGDRSTPDSGSSRSELSSSSGESHLAPTQSADVNSAFRRPRASTFQTRRTSLAPQQIWDLAQTSLNSGTCGENSDTASRHLDRSSPLFYPSREKISAESDSDSSGIASGSSAPFSPLPESQYLPFIDRPSEVATLLSGDANSRFLALLRQTFPSHLREDPGTPDVLDPEHWPFPRLVSYLTEAPRSKYEDKIWTSTVRRCIRARSEVVWERFKDILGVPPELDTEDPSEGNDDFGRGTLESDDEVEEAWVEELYPSSSPLTPVSPVTSMSPSADMGDGGFAYGGRGNAMETIGEGEEDENITTATNTRANSLENGPSAERIRALRLHTRPSLDIGLSIYPERRSPTDANKSQRQTRSFSDGNISSPFSSGHLDHSHSGRSSRRTSIGVPESERGPGNPLFPSNFGRLSIGPTLPANNPLLRRHVLPVPSTYPGNTLTVPKASGPGSDIFHRRSSSGSDYAILLSSESERSLAVIGQ